MASENIGKFALKVNTDGHDEELKGSVFSNAACKVSTEKTINRAVADALTNHFDGLDLWNRVILP